MTHQVTFDVRMSNGRKGKISGHVEGQVVVRVIGGVQEPTGYREYTLTEAVRAALELVQGLELSCNQVVELHDSKQHYEAIRGVSLVVTPRLSDWAVPLEAKL